MYIGVMIHSYAIVVDCHTIVIDSHAIVIRLSSIVIRLSCLTNPPYKVHCLCRLSCDHQHRLKTKEPGSEKLSQASDSSNTTSM